MTKVQPSMSRKALRSWRQLVAAAEKGRRQTRELLHPAPHLPLQLYVGHRAPRVMFIFTKGAFAERWVRFAGALEDTAFVIRHGFPTEALRDLVAEMCERWMLPACFVGDLRPLDLTVYFAWRWGYPGGRRAKELPIRYCGVNDAWLELCERSFRRGQSLDAVLVPMRPFERQHLAVAEALLPELEQLIGPRALGLLRAGWTLHQEGVSNPGLYRRGFDEALQQHLRQRALTPAPRTGR